MTEFSQSQFHHSKSPLFFKQNFPNFSPQNDQPLLQNVLEQFKLQCNNSKFAMTSEERFIYLQLITIFQLKPVVKHCQRSFLLYRLITPTKLFYVVIVFSQYFLNYKIFYHSSGNAFLLLYRFMFVYCNFHCHFDLMRKTLIKFFMIFNQLKYITL